MKHSPREIRYKGCVIQIHPITDRITIIREGVVIATPPTVDDAKRQIDQLVDE